MSCPRRRFPMAAACSDKPIDTERMRETNARLAAMIAEREQQDKTLAFTEVVTSAATASAAVSAVHASAPVQSKPPN